MVKPQWIEFDVPCAERLPSGRLSRKVQYKKGYGALFSMTISGEELHFVLQTKRDGEDLDGEKLVHFESGYTVAPSINEVQIDWMLQHGTSHRSMKRSEAAIATLNRVLKKTGVEKFMASLKKVKWVNSLPK
jgi:hypothetical protein